MSTPAPHCPATPCLTYYMYASLYLCVMNALHPRCFFDIYFIAIMY